MANRDFMADVLTNRWTKTSAPAAGTTLAANVLAPAPQSRLHLETLWYSIINRTGAGALLATVTVSVRNASQGGTVLASVDHIIPASSTANVAITDMAFPGERGQGLAVTMDTVVASLTQKVTMAGWTED